MADKTITELGNQTSADLQDKLVIVDMTQFNTNNIEVGDFATSIFDANLPITSSNLSVTNSFYYRGNKQYNYGQFYDTTIQSGSNGSIQAMKFNSTDVAVGTSIVSGSRIKVENTGVYNLQFSAQFQNTSNTNIGIEVWFAITGSNIPYSATQVDINRDNPSFLGKSVAAWNYLASLQENQYIEIMWSSASGSAQIFANGANSGIPHIPSVITTITQIA